MADATARLALPLLAAGQAQKELFHNEALARLDMLVQPIVQSIGDTAPPAAPSPGQCWIVGTGASGDWAGQDGALAGWTEDGWRFVAPFAGMAVTRQADGLVARCDGSGWAIGEVAAARLTVGGVAVVGAQQPAIAGPEGGATADAEARSTLAAILAALRAHGLIAA